MLHTRGIYLATLYDDFRDAGKKLKNFTLPLVLYTDDGCETCRCNISGEISNEIDSTISVSVQVQGDAQTSYLINSTSSPTYNGIPLNVTNNISQLLTGSLDGILTRRFPINPLTTVNQTTYEVQPLYQYYTTTALPPSELYNLFNTKSKYFNDVPGFGNGSEDGWNQIKVNWFPDINTSLQDYHYDNIMVLVLDKTTPTYNSGDLIAFQDVTLSGDLNRTVTTGTTIFPSALEVKYADPDAPLGGGAVPNLTQYYNVPILSSQTSFDSTTSFAADVEYFQVITGMSIGQYVNLANRATEIKDQIDKATSFYEREKLQERLGKLIGGVAIISVGGNSDIEIKEKKDRVEDALYATKAALADGIVPGGGATLYRVALNHRVESNNNVAIARDIVRAALQAPFKKILSNAGIENWYENIPAEGKVYDAKNHKMVDAVESGIIDPAKVVITAVKNAASVAGTILTTESVVFEKKEKDEKADPMMGLSGMM